MAGKIGKIIPIKKSSEIKDPRTGKKIPSLTNSLLDSGYSRVPGSGVTLVPYREPVNREYRTGLNPDALYIKELEKVNKELAQSERERAKERLAYFKSILGDGLDLGPHGYYYKGVYVQESMKEGPTTSKVTIGYQGMEFDLSDVHQAIAYEWVRVHPDVAPSLEDYTKRKTSARFPDPSNCMFYIEDIEQDQKLQFKKKKAFNEAVAVLNDMSPTERKDISRLLNLPVTASDTEEGVYTMLDDFIKREVKDAESFIRLSTLDKETIKLKSLIKEALQYNVYRKGKGGNIFEGNTLIAESETDLSNDLNKIDNQDMLMALEEKVKSSRDAYERR